MDKIARRVFAALCCALALAAPRARAEESVSQAPPAEPAANPGAGRILGGHRYMPTNAVAQPFLTTSFSSVLVAGLGKTSGTLQVGDRVFSGSYDYAGIGATLAYEYAFLDYFSARVSLSEIIFSGINGSSALVVGTQAQLAGGIGGTLSYPLGDSLRLAALLDINLQPNIALTIGSGLAAILNSCPAAGGQGCNVDPEKIFAIREVKTFQPQVSVAWTPHRAVGVTGAVGYQHAISSATGQPDLTADAMSLGGAVDFDFLAVSSFPLGLMFQMNWTAPFSGTTLQHVTDIGGGIFYTGRKDLAAGVQLIWRRFAVVPNVDVSFATEIAQLGLRYYW
jgi:hypothetical protein